MPADRSSSAPDRAAAALFGSTRRNVLALLFGRPGESFYVREVVRASGTGTGAVQRELASLLRAGLIRRSISGRQVYFSANEASPVFPELRSLLGKTAGIADVFRAGLAELARSGAIEAAFIFGSVATGNQEPGSDIDLLVVGKAGLSGLLPALAPLAERLGREINPIVYTAGEFAAKLARQEHFVQRVMAGPKLMLVGERDELEQLGSHRLDRPAPDEPAGDRKPPRGRRTKPRRRRS
jgi:uncharacterized protein